MAFPPGAAHAPVPRRLVRALLLCGLAASSGWSLAQQAPQVTPRDLRPDLPAPPSPTLPQAQPKPGAIPPGAETLSVTPGRIELSGGFPALAAPAQAVLTPWQGRRVTVADLYRLAEAVEALYRDAGFLLVRVVVPPQSVTDGALFRLALVDGFIEHVDADAVPEPARAQVAALLERLVGRRGLTSAALERSLTLAGRGPGLTLRSTLAPGAAEGAAVLVLDGEFTRWSGSAALDNRLSSTLGPWQWTTQMRVNQPLGRGDQAYAYVSGHPDLTHAFGPGAPRRVAGGGFSLPMGTDGWVFNPEFTWSSTLSPAQTLIPATVSRFQRLTLRTVYPLVLTRAEELALTLSFDISTQSTSAPDFQATLSEDRLRVARVAADWNRPLGQTAQLRLSATLSKGFSGLGARTADDVAATGVAFSRTGADPAFSKLEAGLVWDQALPLQMQSRLALRWQRALHGVLPGSELFSLDGEDALSSFTAGALSDDGGWLVREELSRPFAVPMGAGSWTLSPYLYGAVGRLTSRIAPGPVRGTSSAWGGGLRASWGAFALSAELGRRRSRPSDLNGTQLFVKGQVQF